MKVFIDSSAYLSALMLHDPNNKRALEVLASIKTNKEEIITSHAVLGEVLTVASQKYDRNKGTKFVEDIYESGIDIILESSDLIKKALANFKKIKDKDVSWVDCYSFAIIEAYKIEKVFSFDRDFKKHSKAKVLS